MQQLKSGARTDTGKIRPHNEDSFRSEPEVGLWVVADGMGGQQGGDTASAIASDVIVEGIRAGKALPGPISEAHDAIIRASNEGKGPQGMGTTVVAMRSPGDSYEIAWVGDCRAYLYDGARLRQLTRDHSYLQYLVDQGIITPDETGNHPHQNFVLQALGSTEIEAVAPGLLKDRFYRGEQILLCSDGLVKELTEEEMTEILGMGLEEQETVDRLVAAALERGGIDNITAILVSADPGAPPRMPGDFMHQDVKEVMRYLREYLAWMFS